MFDRRELLGAGALAAAASAMPAGARAAPAFARERMDAGGGITIDVRRSGGDGRAIVFVHGLGQSHLAWSPTLRALGGGRRSVTYDQRGHGGSSRPADLSAYADGARWADDLHGVISAYGGHRPVVVAWSLGGLVLTHYLARRSDAALGGIVFVGAVTDASPSLMRPRAGELLRGLCEPSIEERSLWVPRFVDDSFATRVPDPMRTSMLVANASVPTAVYQAAAALPPADATLLRRVSVPTLVVHGLRDTLVSPEMARRSAASIPGARLRLYEGSGHGPLIDEPDRLARDIGSLTASLA